MSQVEVKRKQIQAFISLLGVITWLVLGRLIGYNGIAYLGAALEGFWLFQILLAERVPDVLGKMIRSRMAKGQFKNADKVRSSILIFQAIVGVLGGVLVFFLAAPITDKVFLMPYGMLALKILAPALTIRVITGIFLGYFQGSGTQMPTVMVSIIRQIMYLGFGVLFVNLFKEYGDKVKLLLLNDSLPSMYGAAGMATAVAVTELLILLFTLLIYFGSRKSRKRQEEGLKKTETFLSSIGSLYGGRSVLMLEDILIRLPIWLGLILYQRSVVDSSASAWNWGKYYGGYLVICAIPVLLGEAMLHPLAARTAVAARKGELHFAGKLLGAAFHSVIAATLFAAVFLTVMASHVSCTLGVSGEESQLVATFLRIGSAAVILAVLAILFMRVLHYMGKTNLVLGAAGLYVIAFVVGMMICLKFLKLEMEGIVYSGLCALVILCLATGIYLIRLLRVKIDFLYWLGIPAAGALACGIICYLLGEHVTPHLGYGLTMSLGLIISVVLYTGILLFFRSFRKQELEVIPGGKILILLNGLLHIE